MPKRRRAVTDWMGGEMPRKLTMFVYWTPELGQPQSILSQVMDINGTPYTVSDVLVKTGDIGHAITFDLTLQRVRE